MNCNDMQWTAMTCNELQWHAINAMTCNELQWHAMNCNDMQWNAMTCNEMQWHAMNCNDMQWTAMTCNELQWHAMNCNDMQWTATTCNELRWNAMKCNEMQWNAMKCNEMQWNAMKCNEMQSSSIESTLGIALIEVYKAAMEWWKEVALHYSCLRRLKSPDFELTQAMASGCMPQAPLHKLHDINCVVARCLVATYRSPLCTWGSIRMTPRRTSDVDRVRRMKTVHPKRLTSFTPASTIVHGQHKSILTRRFYSIR